MIPVEMEPMKWTARLALRKKAFEIPGGWIVHVPEIEVKREDAKEYVDYFTRSGVPKGKAVERFNECVQEAFRQKWIYEMRRYIQNWAKWYYERFGSMKGFNPRELAEIFVPGENAGRRGKKVVRDTLTRMHYETGS